MSRVNPLHIALLLLMVIAFLLFKLEGLTEELQEAKALYRSSEKLAVELRALKSVYANSNKSRAAINRILSQRSLQSTKFDIKRTKKSIIIGAKSIETAALNSLMGKILNGSYNITQLKIDKRSDTKAALTMEIQW